MNDWHKISAMAAVEDDKVKSLPLNGHTYVQGKIGDLIIVQIDTQGMNAGEQMQVMRATVETLKSAGIEKALIMPTGVKFMRMVPVDDDLAAQLDVTSNGQAVVTVPFSDADKMH